MDSDIYKRLGIDTIINAAGHVTAAGGTRMSAHTAACMAQASGAYVELAVLQQVLHGRIASMTRNEAAYISNGAASGLHLSLAACVALKMKRPFHSIPDEQVRRHEVIMYAAHRNPYDWVVRQLGVRLVQLGYPNVIHPPSLEEFIHAITENTAAVCYVAGRDNGWLPKGALSLREVIPVAKHKGIPVIVDAAAQLPPPDNLWRFTEDGVDAVVFSGGKDLAGPQASGLVLGSHELVSKVQEIGFPNYGIGRMMKVGREEMLGLYAALEQYLAMDHPERLKMCNRQMAELSERLKGSVLYRAEILPDNESGQPVPRGFVRILRDDRLTADQLTRLLMEGRPRIYTVTEGEPGIFVNPITLKEGECSAVIARLLEIERDLPS